MNGYKPDPYARAQRFGAKLKTQEVQQKAINAFNSALQSTSDKQGWLGSSLLSGLAGLGGKLGGAKLAGLAGLS